MYQIPHQILLKGFKEIVEYNVVILFKMHLNV